MVGSKEKVMLGAVAALMTVFMFIAEGGDDMEYNELTPDEEYVILHGGTEAPYVGEYNEHFEEGTYACRRCGAELYTSDSKFSAHCGWPAFDSEIEGAVEHRPDADGNRTEIICATCGGHLGHVFEGEGYTETDTRHCVNSISLEFIPAALVTETAVFAGGCFWGIESVFGAQNGVLSTTAGYTGGDLEEPDYQQVCSGATGHAEAVQVVFDPSVVSFEDLARLFFEIHDPTTPDRQGVDVGSQYRSAVFYGSDEQREITEALIAELASLGYRAVTEVEPAGEFWPAEDYHQDFYVKNSGGSACHVRVDRFRD